MASGGADELQVPKFGSFKSKQTQEKPKETEEGRKRDSGRDGKRRSHHDDRRERHRRDGSREPKRRRERPRSHERERYTDREPVAHKSAARASGPELYVVDTKGDPLIRRYGTLDRSKVPAYYRDGHGRVLGTSGRLVIYRDGPIDTFSLRMPGEGIARYRDRDGLRSKRPMAHPHPISLKRRRVAPAAKEEEEDDDEGFLSLRISKKQSRKDDSSDDDQGPSYRSIEGKAKPKTDDTDMDSDSDSDASEDADYVESNNPLQWKSIQLTRRVKENPEDTNSWLELVEHQNELLRASTAEGTAPDNESHSYSEIKVSMLEKALQNARDPADRERILVPLMREGAKVWSSKVAAKKWAEVGSQADSHGLWRVRLEFAMTSIADFDYTIVKTMFVERLRHVLSNNPESTEAYLQVIEVFLLATRFVHDSGYKELAVAAWQALLELTFFRPDVHGAAVSVPDSFQEFWESEVARIGDLGASGWKHYVETGGEDEPPEPLPAQSIAATAAARSKNPFTAWSQLEIEHSNEAKLPARTMDDGTEEDPFRVVTYTDVEPFLFMIPLALVSSIGTSLFDAFLIFCGLPPASSNDWARTLYKDQLLAPVWGDVPSVAIGAGTTSALQDDESIVRSPPLFSRPYSAFSISSRLLFPGKEWFSYLPSPLSGTLIDSSWLEATLGQLIFSAGCDELSEYYLAVSSARDPSSVKKTAKKLLRRGPENAALYNAYALAEHSRGNSDVAANVIESALASTLISKQSSRLRLRHTAAWMALENGHLASSKKALCAGDGSEAEAEVSFADVLKASSAFSGGMSESLSVGDVESAETAAECLVLHSYLTSSEASEPMSLSQGSISAAMQTLDTASQELVVRGHGGSPACERLVQFGAHLLYLHAARGPHRRAYIRGQMRKHLRSFPGNAILLSVLEWSDSGLRVVDETRQLLRDHAAEGGGVGGQLLAVQHELLRRGGGAHAAREAFEQAVRSDDAGRASAALWTWYVRFAHAHGGAAVAVLYRALRHCPWAKAVLMEAFRTLAAEMPEEELRSVYGMMTAKGLRVHVELDEVLKSRVGEGKW